MGFADRFERRLQGAVGDAFARVFGGGVMPQEVEAALQREARDRLQFLAGGVALAPNQYHITLNDSDRGRFDSDRDVTQRALAHNLAQYIADQGWQTYGRVEVGFLSTHTLHTGQFRTLGSVNPDLDQPSAPNPQDYGAPSPVADEDGDGWTPTLVVLDGSNRSYPLHDGSTVIGRGMDANVRIVDTGVSRLHAEIQWNGQSALLVDLNSTNGTMVNDAEVQRWQLSSGDVIRIGNTDIAFRFA